MREQAARTATAQRRNEMSRRVVAATTFNGNLVVFGDDGAVFEFDGKEWKTGVWPPIPGTDAAKPEPQPPESVDWSA